MNSFFEQTLGQEQHVNQHISTIGFHFGSTSITNAEIVSADAGTGVFAQVIARNPKVRPNNTVANIMHRLLNSLDARINLSQVNSLTQIVGYLQRVSLYQRIAGRFPSAPISLIITKSGRLTTLICSSSMKQESSLAILPRASLISIRSPKRFPARLL